MSDTITKDKGLPVSRLLSRGSPEHFWCPLTAQLLKDGEGCRVSLTTGPPESDQEFSTGERRQNEYLSKGKLETLSQDPDGGLTTDCRRKK